MADAVHIVELSADEEPTAVLEPVGTRHDGVEHRYVIAFAVVLAAVMQVIDSSIVNVALPDMMGNLGASLDEIAWVSTGYILASVIVIPLTGFLGDLFGRKRYFVGSIVIFTLSSFFCGASGSLGALIFWRIVQGVGGGALMTVSQAVLFESFPTEEAGTAMALFGLGVMVGPTIGPTLGGWLTDNYGWPWIFYVNIPVGILAAVMIAGYVHDPAYQKKPRRIDYTGIGLARRAHLLAHRAGRGWRRADDRVAGRAVRVVSHRGSRHGHGAVRTRRHGRPHHRANSGWLAHR
jgi:MFS transporter, DHA2 family, multidrug resistance protein